MANSCVSLAYRKGLTPGRRVARRALFIVLAFATCSGMRAQSPKELRIAAAADLEPVMPSLAAAYEKATGAKLIISYGSSATLTQQLRNGDPQDLFLSADMVHPGELIAAKLASGLNNADTPTVYARGVLVLWARNDSAAQPLALSSLTKPGVTRIAVANSVHAPYGLAAKDALSHLHLTQQIAGKLVVAENIAQAAQFAESANAQAGLISLTLANSTHLRSLGTFVRFPPSTYPPIRQCAVILNASGSHAAAEHFLRWLTSSSIQSKLPSLGLDPAS